MSIRLDPRRLGTLKQLAGEAGVRPGDLVRQWVEERIDASRTGAGGGGLAERLDALEARIAALEAWGSPSGADAAQRTAPPEPERQPAPDAQPEAAEPVAAAEVESTANGDGPPQARMGGRPRRSASASPSGPRVGLHDEMIAVIAERGPLTAGELAEAITARGRYAPPRSGKPLDAATVSQRASNPTYRSRFVRSDGRIGLSQPPEEG